MTSSTKPEVHNILQLCHWRTEPWLQSTFTKFREVKPCGFWDNQAQSCIIIIESAMQYLHIRRVHYQYLGYNCINWRWWTARRCLMPNRPSLYTELDAECDQRQCWKHLATSTVVAGCSVFCTDVHGGRVCSTDTRLLSQVTAGAVNRTQLVHVLLTTLNFSRPAVTGKIFLSPEWRGQKWVTCVLLHLCCGWFFIHTLGLAMINLYAKFDVCLQQHGRQRQMYITD